MRDPSISMPSEETLLTQTPEPISRLSPTRSLSSTALPEPTQSPSLWPSEEPSREPELVGLRLYSGTGELLGAVVGVVRDRYGRPKHLAFIEPGSAIERRAPLRVVRRVDDAGVHLAGPREGYHITRLGR